MENKLKSVANSESEDTPEAGAAGPVDTASSTPAVEPEKGPDPFDLERLALNQSFAETIGVKKLLTHVPVGKPGNQNWFQVHPDPKYRRNFLVINLKTEREIYLVSPEMGAELAGECIPVTVFTVVSSVSVVSLWPVRLPGPDGKDLAWWVTEREAAALGKEHWVRIKANMALGANDIDVSDHEAKMAGCDVPGACENRLCRAPHRQRRPLRRQATAWARLGCGKVSIPRGYGRWTLSSPHFGASDRCRSAWLLGNSGLVVRFAFGRIN